MTFYQFLLAYLSTIFIGCILAVVLLGWLMPERDGLDDGSGK